MEDYHSDSEIFLQNVKNKIEATKDINRKRSSKKGLDLSIELFQMVIQMKLEVFMQKLDF